MKHILLFPTLACVLALVAASSRANDPTPRKMSDPHDDAQVKQEMAKRWRQFGVNDSASSNTITKQVNTGPGGTKGCNTTIGPSAPAAPAQGSGRYGPQAKPSITVVTGSVINVCR